MTIQSRNEAVRSMAFGTVTNAYQDLGAVTAHPTYQLIIQNTTDKLVVLSKDDGATDWLRIPASTSMVLDYIVFTEGMQRGLIAKGTQFQIKGITAALPTSGEVSISVEYLVGT